LFGYCYGDNGKSKSCEATTVFINVAVDADMDLTRQYGLHLVNDSFPRYENLKLILFFVGVGATVSRKSWTTFRVLRNPF
jgi:hypothetical protein